MPCSSFGTIIQGCPALASPESHRRAPKRGKALREEVVSNCSRQEQILPLLHMENIPSWKLSWAPSWAPLWCLIAKSPLASLTTFAASGLMDLLWDSNSSFEWKNVIKHHPAAHADVVWKGGAPQSKRRNLVLAVWFNYTSVSGWLSPTP